MSSTAYTPLLQTDNSILDAVGKYVIKGDSILKTDARKVALIAGVIFGVSLGLVGRYPFVAPAVEFANKSTALEVFYGYSAFLGLGSLSAWALVNLFVEQIIPQTIEQEFSKKSCLSYSANKIYLLGLAAIGITAQLSIAYMGYFFNKRNGLVWVAIILLADSGLPAYSMHLLFQDLANKNTRFAKCIGHEIEEHHKEIADFKGIILKKIEERRAEVIKFGNQLDALSLSALESSDAKASQLMQDLIEEKKIDSNQLYGGLEPYFSGEFVEQKEKPSLGLRCQKMSQIVCSYLPGVIFPIIGFIFRGKLSYEGAKLVWNNPVFKWLVVAVSTGPTAYVSFMVTTETFRSIHDNVVNFFCGKSVKTYSSTFYPKSLLAFKAFGLFTAAFTFASIAKTAEQFFGPNFLGYIVMTGSSVNLSSLVANSQLDFIDWITTPIIKRFGNDNARRTGKLLDKIDVLSKIIKEANEGSMREFIQKFDKQFWINAGISNDQSYLNSLMFREKSLSQVSLEGTDEDEPVVLR